MVSHPDNLQERRNKRSQTTKQQNETILPYKPNYFSSQCKENQPDAFGIPGTEMTFRSYSRLFGRPDVVRLHRLLLPADITHLKSDFPGL